MSGTISVGPAGWHYEDWAGIVYPAKRSKDFGELNYLAHFFDVVEVNSSFYRIPSASMVAGWVDKVAFNPSFRFSVKLHQSFTHERAAQNRENAESFSAALAPLVRCGRLCTVLAQFPWSFKNNDENRIYLQNLIKTFQPLTVHCEFRHLSWTREGALGQLAEWGAGFVNIDQPVIGESIGPTVIRTHPLAYVRLHGRNYQNWFREGAGRNARYDYLYPADELEEWASRIQELSATAEKTIVIFNNHFKGQAVVNSLQLMAQLFRKSVDLPGALLATYPSLSSIARPSSGQTSLPL